MVKMTVSLIGDSQDIFITAIPRRFTIWPALVAGAAGMFVCNALLSLGPGVTATTVMIFAGGLMAGPMAVWPAAALPTSGSSSGRSTTSQ